MSNNQHLIVTISSKPGHESDLKSVLLELVKASRAETGCIRYDLAQSGSNSETFFLVECWESEQSLRDHEQTPHFIEGVKKIQALSSHADIQNVNRVEPDEYTYVYTVS